MKCEIERMEINYTFYFFAFLRKMIKKLLTFCYWQDSEKHTYLMRREVSPIRQCSDTLSHINSAWDFPAKR